MSGTNLNLLSGFSKSVGIINDLPTAKQSLTKPTQETQTNEQTISSPTAYLERTGFDQAAQLKLQSAQKFNAGDQTLQKSASLDVPNADTQIFKTSGGTWRVRNGESSEHPTFYQSGADISGTQLFDEQFYQTNGKWIELNAGGRLADTPENKDKLRPANIPEFEWQGWREISASDIPADYTSEGKTIAFAETTLADTQKNVFKRYLVDQHLIQDWDEVLGERLIDSAMQKGATIELVNTSQTNTDGKTVFQVKMNDRSLEILRSEIKDYNHQLTQGAEAQTKGRQEANRDVADMFGAVYETGRIGLETTLNALPDSLNTVFSTDPSCTDKTIPRFGRVKFGASFDKACEQTKNSQSSNLLPTFDTSSIKYDFRSEWMRRDINGKVDGKGIKLGETTFIAGQIAPNIISRIIDLRVMFDM